MRAIILILKILALWLPCVANVIEINCDLRWQALGFAELLKGLGYVCLWAKTEHRRAELLWMTEGKGFGVGGIWKWREMGVREEVVWVKEKCGAFQNTSLSHDPEACSEVQRGSARCECGSFDLNPGGYEMTISGHEVWGHQSQSPPWSLNRQTQRPGAPGVDMWITQIFLTPGNHWAVCFL